MQIAGSLAVWLDAVPVSDGIAPGDVVAGRECGVIFFTEDNPADAAIVTIHNAVPVGWPLNTSHKVVDADASTYVDVEQSADEDAVRMAVGGTLRYLLQGVSPHHTLTGDVTIPLGTAYIYGKAGGASPSVPNAQCGLLVGDSGESFNNTMGIGIFLGDSFTIGSNQVIGLGGHAYGQANVTGTVVGLDFNAGHQAVASGNKAVIGVRINSTVAAITAATITDISVASPTVVTTAAAHGLSNGQTVNITGSNSTPSINGLNVISNVTSTTFTVPVNVTVQGTAGSVYQGTLNVTGLQTNSLGALSGSFVAVNQTGLSLAATSNAKVTNWIGLSASGSGYNAATVVRPMEIGGPARTTDTDGSYHRMNMQFGSATRKFGGGDGVIGLTYAVTNPTANPTGGVIIYADVNTGDVKVRGAGGQIVKLPSGGATNVTGSRGGNAALASLLTVLAGLGLIVDGTSA